MPIPALAAEAEAAGQTTGAVQPPDRALGLQPASAITSTPKNQQGSPDSCTGTQRRMRRAREITSSPPRIHHFLSRDTERLSLRGNRSPAAEGGSCNATRSPGRLLPGHRGTSSPSERTQPGRRRYRYLAPRSETAGAPQLLLLLKQFQGVTWGTPKERRLRGGQPGLRRPPTPRGSACPLRRPPRDHLIPQPPPQPSPPRAAAIPPARPPAVSALATYSPSRTRPRVEARGFSPAERSRTRPLGRGNLLRSAASAGPSEGSPPPPPPPWGEAGRAPLRRRRAPLRPPRGGSPAPALSPLPPTRCFQPPQPPPRREQPRPPPARAASAVRPLRASSAREVPGRSAPPGRPPPAAAPLFGRKGHPPPLSPPVSPGLKPPLPPFSHPVVSGEERRGGRVFPGWGPFNNRSTTGTTRQRSRTPGGFPGSSPGGGSASRGTFRPRGLPAAQGTPGVSGPAAGSPASSRASSPAARSSFSAARCLPGGTETLVLPSWGLALKEAIAFCSSSRLPPWASYRPPREPRIPLSLSAST